MEKTEGNLVKVLNTFESTLNGAQKSVNDKCITPNEGIKTIVDGIINLCYAIPPNLSKAAEDEVREYVRKGVSFIAQYSEPPDYIVIRTQTH